MASTSSLFQNSGHCGTRFEKNQQYRNYEPLVRDIWPGIIYQIKEGIDIDDLGSSKPFSGSSLFQYGWKKSPKPGFSNFTKKIVKGIIMIILTQKRTQVTLLKLNTSPDYQGMNSRAFSKKVENRPKLKFIKIALELNPSIQDP